MKENERKLNENENRFFLYFETMSGVTKRSEKNFLVTKERKAYRVE